LKYPSKRLGATAVLDDGRLIGVVTDGDLRRMIENIMISIIWLPRIL